MSDIRFSPRHSLLAAVALFILGTQAQGQTGPNTLHVLAVGVNDPVYLSQPPLRSADKDALAHAKFWPTQQGKLFGKVNVAPALTNEKATADAILAELDRMDEAVRAGDSAVVQLAGHGGGVRSGEWKFCAHDRKLPSSELRARIERLAKKGVRVLLILDTCESGGVGIAGDNIVVLAACQADENTRDGERNGLFTELLLAGLAGGADANKDRVVTLAELNAYVAGQMEERTSRQSPVCGCPTNIRSNLPLAAVAAPTGSAGPGAGALTGSTGPHR